LLTIDLSGQHVLITGAGGGIGRALVAAFREAGADVSAFDLEDEAIAGLDVSHRAAFDIRDADAVSRALDTLFEAAGTPDVLVNNAGWTRAETLPRVDRHIWHSEVELNLNGAFHVTEPVLAKMAVRGSGAILFVASVNALMHFGNPAYSAAKAGMVALCRAIAVEYGEKGVRANALCPGSVRTAAWDHRIAVDPAIMEDAGRFYPLGRIVEPREVANAALFLCSPLASGITGVALPVDAGLTAGSIRFVRDIIGREG
jgi:NAD(P)-dependent dehydrogenase (short-subunit alcohol dehydrogenase family)